MNILILSSGTRNKIVQYFRKDLEGNGNVICTDMGELFLILILILTSHGNMIFQKK